MNKYKLGQKVLLLEGKPQKYEKCDITYGNADALMSVNGTQLGVSLSLLSSDKPGEVEIVGHQGTVIPICWLGWGDMSELTHYYYQAAFTEDFGVFKKGLVEHGLSVDYGKGILTQTDEHGNVILQQQFKAVPV